MENDYTKYSKQNNEEKQDEVIMAGPVNDETPVENNPTEVVEETTEVEEVVNEAVEEMAANDTVELSEEVENVSEEEVITIEDPNSIVEGVINNCTQLNIRKEASKTSEIVEVVDAGAKVLIDEASSTEDFYKVVTPSGVEGYCMKSFVKVD